MKPRSPRVGARRASGAWRALPLAALAACWDAAPTATPAPTAALCFVDASQGSGLARVAWAGRPGKDHLLDSAGTGLALLDADDDGRLDVFTTSGWKLDGSTVLERGGNALYLGRGDGTFRDVTDASGVAGDGRWGSGVFAADVDGDGRTDVLVTGFGGLSLFHNLGGGRFEDVAGRVGLVMPEWNTGAAFLDADLDGDLDLYVAAYIQCSMDDVFDAQRTLRWKDVEQVALGPFGLVGAPDRWFRQEADGRFTESTEAAGLTDRALGFGFAVRALDYDEDGDPDLFVANDSDPNYLYRNAGDGTFTDVGVWSGAALDGEGQAQACMGVAAGDVDGDGRTDLFVTNFAEDHCTLYRALAGGLFDDATARAGLRDPTWLPLSWGTALADLDEDGDLDLVVVNGHIYPQADSHPEFHQAWLQAPLLLVNAGGRFRDASAESGPAFATPRAGRGLAVGDVDGDGDLDLVVSQLDGPPALLVNQSPPAHWLMVDCRVPPGRGVLPGTRVLVTSGGHVQQRDVAAGDSYLSTHDPRAHFGLGAADRIDEVRVRWPDGTETLRRDVPTNEVLRMTKGD